jgi:acyl-coenzyme A thioesterase PaaI-like protein
MPTETTVHKPLSVAEVDALIDLHFPQIHANGRVIRIEAIGHRTARLRLIASDGIIRPGGTISGPAMFTLADFGIYATLLGEMGEGALQAVTSNLNITFLARPEQRDLIAEIEILRLGRRQAIGEVRMRSDGSDTLVAHAIATYAMPQKR